MSDVARMKQVKHDLDCFQSRVVGVSCDGWNGGPANALTQGQLRLNGWPYACTRLTAALYARLDSLRTLVPRWFSPAALHGLVWYKIPVAGQVLLLQNIIIVAVDMRCTCECAC
jgi:hypothetical protein